MSISTTFLGHRGVSVMNLGLRCLSRRPNVSGFSSQATKVSQNNEFVTVLTLNNLADNQGAVRKKRRVGRGVGSSKGKTSGRGHKGQKSRSGGNIHPMFEGGQTKFYKAIPKRGFVNKPHGEPMTPVNLGMLQDYIDMGRLDTTTDKVLTMKDFVNAGMLTTNSIKHGVKLLAKGKERLKTPVKLEISRASSSAIDAVENVGGEVTTVHYNRLALRALLKPHLFDVLPRRARPPPRLMPYYTHWKNRGYLSPQAQMRKLLKARGAEGGDASEKTKQDEK